MIEEDPAETALGANRAMSREEHDATIARLTAGSMTITIPFESIIVDKGINVRKSYTKIGEMADSIVANGLLAPPIVAIKTKTGVEASEIIAAVRAGDLSVLNGATFDLLVGFCRVMAITRLRDAAIAQDLTPPFNTIDVKLYEGTEMGRWMINLTENIVRSGISSWEIGDQCKLIKDQFQVDIAFICAKIGYEKSHIYACLRIVEQIDKELQEEFRSGRAEPPFRVLHSMAMRFRQGQPMVKEQREIWDRWAEKKKEKAASSKKRKGGEGEEGDDRPVYSSGKMKRLREAERILSKLQSAFSEAVSESAKEYFRGAIASAKFLMGLTNKIKGIDVSKPGAKTESDPSEKGNVRKKRANGRKKTAQKWQEAKSRKKKKRMK